MSPQQRARLELIAAAVCFSTAGAALKACRLDGWEVASLRAAIAGVTVLALVPLARRGLTPRAAIVAVPYTATALLFVLANKMTTAASTIFLQSTSPLYIALLGPWLLHEKTRRRDLLYMGVLAAGLVLVFLGVDPPARLSPRPLLGNVLAVGCGFTVAVMMIGLRRLARAGASNEAAAPGAVVLGNLLTFTVALPFALPLGPARPSDWLILAYLGVVQIGAGYALMLRGLRHVPALEATLLMFVEPVLSPVWAWIVHGEAAGPWVVAGGFVILGGTAVYLWAQRGGLTGVPGPHPPD
ncbi:MAG TPA: DMT family transporter [Vicinamibacteria bacterium]|nr:DMT family transporter [Vicinamibacteria bacterium]